jgi:membrane protease YdiL (CAAX protease family)
MSDIRDAISDLTPGGKLVFLILACLLSWLVATLFVFSTVPLFFGYSYSQIPNLIGDVANEASRYVMMYLQGGSSLGLFVGGAILYGFFAEKDQSVWYNWSSQAPQFSTWGIFLGVIVLLGMLPMVSYLEQINQSIPFPEFMSGIGQSLQQRQDALMEQIDMLLHIESIGDFVLATIVLAVIPAIGEEWVFRGKLQGLLQRLSGSAHGGVWLTSFLFAVFHQQFFAVLPMMFLALFLGYVYAYTRSLWTVVAIHFANNFTSLVFVYLNGEGINYEPDIPSWVYLASGSLVTGMVTLLVFHWRKLGVYGLR